MWPLSSSVRPMTASDEFVPPQEELDVFLHEVVRAEIHRASTDLGIDGSFSAHLLSCGNELLLSHNDSSSWAVRAIFRHAHSQGRALAQMQARLCRPHSTGYCGFVLKGGYDRSNPSSFRARSRTNEYNTVGFRGWA